ncbi:hypothetical protein ACOSP7_011009 [Xanthoceras sorbifolium]
MAEERQVISCNSKDFWEQEHFRTTVIVNFTASWCEPCRLMAPFLNDLAKKTPNVVFLRVDVDKLESVAMPTFICVENGKQLERLVWSIEPKRVEVLSSSSQLFLGIMNPSFSIHIYIWRSEFALNIKKINIL